MPYTIHFVACGPERVLLGIELVDRFNEVLRKFLYIDMGIGVFIPTLLIVNMSKET